MKIVITNSSVFEVQALQRAIDEHEIDARIEIRESSSGVNAQPVGMRETCRGALNRMKSCDVSEKQLIVSIQGGLLVSGEEINRKVEDFFIVLVSKGGEKRVWERTQTVIFPADQYHSAEAAGFEDLTVRDFLEAEGVVGQGVDPYLSFGDKRSQVDIIYDAIVSCFFQLKLTKDRK